MSLSHILLGLLREPSTGYDLKAVLSDRIRHFWSAEISQIYPALKRLEQRHLLQSRVEPSPKGPNRKVYMLTEEGRKELLDWLRGGPVIGMQRFAYLAQAYFMDALGDFRETRAFMISVRDHFSRVLAHLQAIEREVTDTAGHMPECYSDAGFHRFAALRMGILSVKSKVVWCDETIESIDRRLAGGPLDNKPNTSRSQPTHREALEAREDGSA